MKKKKRHGFSFFNEPSVFWFMKEHCDVSGMFNNHIGCESTYAKWRDAGISKSRQSPQNRGTHLMVYHRPVFACSLATLPIDVMRVHIQIAPNSASLNSSEWGNSSLFIAIDVHHHLVLPLECVIPLIEFLVSVHSLLHRLGESLNSFNVVDYIINCWKIRAFSI